MEADWLVQRLLLVLLLIASLSVHEWAHAWTAFQLGDDTAAGQGRLTLDPIPHIDPLGTLLLPLMGIPFGWAKPVPVNPARFTTRISPGAGMALTAFAGPLSNFVLAALAWTLTLVVDPGGFGGGRVGDLLHTLVFLNIALGVLNLLPIPPLDGSRIADYLMPRRLRGAWSRVGAIGVPLLLGLLLLPELMGVGVVGAVVQALFDLAGVVTG